MHRTVAAVLLALLAFPCFAAIRGTVMTSDGAPIANARVSVHAVETPDARRARWLSATPHSVPLLSTQTDKTGNWSLESPKEPVVDVRISAPGFDPLQRRIERDEETGAVVLVKSEMKSGTIRGGGKPVAGATVVISYGGAEYVEKTDEQGKYDAPDPRRARTINVIHPDWAIEEEFFMSTAAASALNRTLTPGTTITGKVLGTDGKPAAKVPVMVDEWPLAVSGDDGSFTVAHAPSKWSSLTAQTGSLAAMRAQSNEKSFSLKLAKAGTFTGRVTDTKTKLPVPGAGIQVGQRLGRMAITPTAAVFTDAKGNFSMTVPPGAYMVTAIHPAYDLRPTDLSVSAGQTQSRDLPAVPLARVSGTVVNEDRKPVAAATIVAEEAGATESFSMSPMRMMRDSVTVTGPDGRFSTRVQGDSDMRVKASRRGLPPAKSDTFRIAPGDRKSGIVVTIPSGIAVSGKVTDRDGNPLSGVTVVASEVAGGPRGGMIRSFVMLGAPGAEEDNVKTGTDGLFTLQVKEGTYDFVFRREGFAAKTLRGQTISVTSNAPLEASLEPAVEITGRIVRNGVGIDGVMINTFSDVGSAATTTSGPDGSFVLSGLSPGELRASMRKETDFIQEMRTLTAPGRDVLIELPIGSRVSGRVIDKATRKPLTSFQAGVSVSRGGGGMVMMAPPQLRAFTNDDGMFTLENIPTGAVNLIATAPGYAQARMNLTLEEGKPLTGIEIEVDPGTKLVGKVTGPDNSPASGATVRVAPQSGSGMINFGGMGKQTVTDSNGEYTLEALEPTDTNIEFSHQKYVGTRKEITVKGAEVRLDVQLSAGQRITGVVVTESGAPVPDAEVAAMAGAGAFRTARTDANGTFAFESLSPARYRFSASKRGFAEARVDDVDVSAGAPVRLVMKSGATLYGQVRGLTPEELQSAMVEFRGETFTTTSVDSTGNYRLEGAPIGTVRVAGVVSRNFSTRKSSQPQTVTVAAGESRQVDLEFRSDTVITGRVTRNGKPLASASVSFTPRRGASSQTSSSATTDQQGNYSVSGLEAGDYSVYVIDMQRFSPYQTTYDVSGSSTFDIDYNASALRGRVIDAATGDPLNDARVRLRATAATDGPFRGEMGAATDVNGNFTIDFVAPGTYTISADKTGFAQEPKEIVITDRQPADLEFRLSKNDGVTLKVVDARNGQAINGVVWVFDQGGRFVQDSGMRFGQSASDIKLTLPPGAYVATVTSIDYAPVTVNLTSPGTQSVGLSRGGKIVVHSTRSDRQRVRLVDARGVVYPRTTNPNPVRELAASPATLPLDHIAPGSYSIQVLTNNDTTVVRSVPVVVTEGGAIDVDV
jgi:uncharacterized GH25 family protein